MLDDIKFYTYIYLDPRKIGIFQYGKYAFKYEPFYVGKGKNDLNRNQLNAHLSEAKRNTPLNKCSNSHKTAKIRKILNENLEPIILKVEDNISEKEAFDLEIWLIWAIGRSDLKLGPLTNQTSGGDGGSNPSEATRRKISETHKGKIISKETRLKLSIANKGKSSFFKGKTHSEESLLKMRGRVCSEETKEKMRESLKRRPWSQRRFTY